MPQGTTVINRFGTLTGWNRVKMIFGNRPFEGIMEIVYEESQDIEGVKGAGAYDVGIGEGDISTSGSVTLFFEEYIQILRSLPPGKKFTDMAAMPVPVAYKLTDGTVYTDVLKNVRFKTNTGVNVKRGDKVIGIKFDIYFSHVAHDGVDPL